jgi:hypothetical protein
MYWEIYFHIHEHPVQALSLVTYWQNSLKFILGHFSWKKEEEYFE